MMSAPLASIASAMSSACAASRALPPSEKESGVTLSTPITKVRGPSTSGARPGILMENDRRGAAITPPTSLLSERLADRLHRRNDRGALLLLRRSRGVSRRRVGRRRVIQRMAVGEPADLVGVEDLARQQRVGDVDQPLLVLGENRGAALVLIANNELDLGVDLKRRVFAVVGVLRDLAAEEDLLFFLAEGQRAHRFAHAPPADHAPGHVGGAL